MNKDRFGKHTLFVILSALSLVLGVLVIKVLWADYQSFRAGDLSDWQIVKDVIFLAWYSFFLDLTIKVHKD